MSGIVGSRLNNRGSGIVGSIGTDGQVFTSSGAGAGAVFEAAAGGVDGITDNSNANAITIDSSENVAIDSGNLVISTSGKGIDFAADADAAAMEAEILDDYEEGTWTPAFGGSPSGSYTYQYGDYTKVGTMVSFTCFIQANMSGGSGSALVSGLPFTPTGAGNDTYYESVTVGFTLGLGTSLYQAFVDQTSAFMYILGEPSSGARTHVNISDVVTSDCYMTLSGRYCVD